MTAFDIYAAVGGVGEDILEESEIMPKKKITKIIPLMTAAACFAVFAAGISHALRSDNIEQPVTESDNMVTESYVLETVTENELEETTAITSEATQTIPSQVLIEPNEPTETTEISIETFPVVTEVEESGMPDPFGNKAEGTGGDENDGFYLPCNYILNNIPVELMKLRDSNEVNKWLEKDKLSSRSEAPSSIKDYVNIYSFITEFNITREEAETALEYYLNTPEEFEHITYEHLDIIFSGNVELITKTFASEYSIVIGDRIYTPEWLYTHSIEEYKAAGITAEDILSRVKLYSSIFFTDEARQAFSEKLSAYTGETVVIKEMEFQEKDDVYDVQEDEAELVDDTYNNDIVDEVVVPEVY